MELPPKLLKPLISQIFWPRYNRAEVKAEMKTFIWAGGLGSCWDADAVPLPLSRAPRMDHNPASVSMRPAVVLERERGVGEGVQLAWNGRRLIGSPDTASQLKLRKVAFERAKSTRHRQAWPGTNSTCFSSLFFTLNAVMRIRSSHYRPAGLMQIAFQGGVSSLGENVLTVSWHWQRGQRLNSLG